METVGTCAFFRDTRAPDFSLDLLQVELRKPSSELEQFPRRSKPKCKGREEEAYRQPRRTLKKSRFPVSSVR